MLKAYFLSIMKDERKTLDSRVIGILLTIMSFVYLAISRLVYWLYKIRFLRSFSVKPKVISVGNLTLGGTGKTPFTIALTDKIAQMGKNPAVLIRGYGDDESHVLKSKLKGAPILIGRDRVKNARVADKQWGSSCVILDDGFQHFRIRRDLDIVLVDATSPFDNARIFPRGILREPLSRLKDADLAIVTKSDMEPQATQRICKTIREISRNIDIAESFYEAAGLCDVFSGKVVPQLHLKGKRVVLLAGIANPTYFEWMVKRLGCRIAERMYYTDHYPYNAEDVKHVAKRCLDYGADLVVTTEKDGVRLRRAQQAYDGIEFLALRIDCRISKNEEKIDSRLHSLFNS